MLVRTPACIKTISGFSYLQRGTRIHCVPPQAIQYILFSLVRGYSRSLPIHPLIPGDGLQQQLPSQPHIASSLIGKKKKKFPPADALETCAFAGSQTATKSFTAYL